MVKYSGVFLLDCCNEECNLKFFNGKIFFLNKYFIFFLMLVVKYI